MLVGGALAWIGSMAGAIALRLVARKDARSAPIAALLVAAILLFLRAHRDLGANWSPSVEINARQTLITSGVYRVIRHPMYASQLLWCVAQALLLHNWIAGLAGFVIFLPMYLVRVPNEEQMMLDHFGNRYQGYCQRTGRLLPRVRS